MNEAKEENLSDEEKLKLMVDFNEKILKNTKDLDLDIAEFIDKHFWELLL